MRLPLFSEFKQENTYNELKGIPFIIKIILLKKSQ